MRRSLVFTSVASGSNVSNLSFASKHVLPETLVSRHAAFSLGARVKTKQTTTICGGAGAQTLLEAI